MNPPRRIRRPAFTLVELLVSIAMIALLISILLPSLARARHRARSIACQSNLRQLFLANRLYADAAGDHYAPGAADFLANLDRWFGHRDSVYDVFEPSGGPLSPYLGPDGAVRRCPSLILDHAVAGGIDFEAGCGGYGYNNAYLGVRSRTDDVLGVVTTRITNPSDTLMFCDAAFAVNPSAPTVIEYSFAEPPRQRDAPQYPDNPSLHFRHDHAANAVWSDGHLSDAPMAGTMSNIYGISAQQMQLFNIGWFDPVDTNVKFDLR